MRHLKNGLESWRKQLEKLTRHAEALSHSGLLPKKWESRPSSESSDSSPVSTQRFILDGFEKLNNQPSDENDGEKEKTMPRMMERLEELKEYNDKIRSCGTIVEGMMLATQMVRDSIPGEPSAIRCLQMRNRTLTQFRNGMRSAG